MSQANVVASTWAPLRNSLFRSLWIAALVSNIGTWMQTVGAQWLLVSQPHAPILVSLVQTADMLPDLTLGLVGGVLADIFDRRRLLIAVQAALAIIGAALTILTIANQMPPALLLLFTLLLGSGSVLINPAYQSLVPEIVPRSEVRAASALSSISINLARAIGPAIAGLLIARSGVAAVFALNTATYVFFGIVVLTSPLPGHASARFPEPFLSAMRAGGRYVRYSRAVRRLLLRCALFLVPASALWALLPLIASRQLGQGSDGYGLLLGALGAGAIAGAFVLPRIRAMWSVNALLVTAGVTYAVVLAAVALVHNMVVSLVTLLPAGTAWIAVLSSLNAELQLFLPAWVRARGVSIYLMVLFGSQAFGALAWGVVADRLGLQLTFLIAAAMLVAATATIRRWPLTETSGIDPSAVQYWPEPQLALEAEADAGPVLVQTIYTVAPERHREFLEAIVPLRRSRLRTGASGWGLFRRGESANEFVEFFTVSSWAEHLLQHDQRLTAIDRQHEERVNALSDPPPQTSHLLAADLPDG